MEYVNKMVNYRTSFHFFSGENKNTDILLNNVYIYLRS